jgi:hypothetical protein
MGLPLDHLLNRRLRLERLLWLETTPVVLLANFHGSQY